jgi:hypothetical protein
LHETRIGGKISILPSCSGTPSLEGPWANVFVC